MNPKDANLNFDRTYFKNAGAHLINARAHDEDALL